MSEPTLADPDASVTDAARDRSGRLFVIAAPSGGGKTSLVKALLEADPQLSLSISHTTRPMRPGERDGEHYHFTNEAGFRKRLERGEFLEHATVFGNLYGTHAGALQDQLDSGRDVILEIDWQGAAQVRYAFPYCCSVFIVPPSLAVLRERLSQRGQDSAQVIENRMAEARSEISHAHEFDYIVINDRFDEALSEIRDIIAGVRTGQPPAAAPRANLLAALLQNE
ncbi:MAG: guanylate kinase [Xanthomonadales bacterium]|nr:guanylate kinase [Xanthomonadales bacterium]